MTAYFQYTLLLVVYAADLASLEDHRSVNGGR
jgi:hypothetical protein